MCNIKLLSISIACACALSFAQTQQTDPTNRSNVFLENKEKPPKPSDARNISGLVKDQKDNPISGAIVQLKDMRTSKVVDFPTKDDGKFAFHDLRMDNDYELTAKHAGLTSVKKVTTYDTRKNVVLTFKLEPATQETAR